ncbi:MAG TPA: NAD(P)/FAD-dependent oxidoreductase [Solirubrobacteraceae bacterium]|nr:NAD(P)/FAD-dependent oxidoreductase [Solirubrobacteraceae bacterium]
MQPSIDSTAEIAAHVDVLIVGAGLSGIGAACHLQQRCPGRTFTIIESRGSIGGTWDLFRYPGIRSDSDMFTLGYSFKPWLGEEAIAPGDAIRSYIREAADEHAVTDRIRFNSRVVGASWSSERSLWTVEIEQTESVAGGAEVGERTTMTCSFLFGCTGYYRYEEGYTPEFDGIEHFGGTLVHPQHWPEDLDYAGKRVVVIGSGATAVTLVPAMAREAAHVTMLQRSPSYILTLPGRDPIAELLRRVLPERTAYSVIRWKNVVLALGMFKLSRSAPKLVRRLLRGGVERQLPAGYDFDTHFKPRYDPWDQRVCFVPDGDMFKAISSGEAEIVTGKIDTFTETGVRLEDGTELEADVIVTATGLNLLALGGIEIAVDGREVDLAETVGYKGMMLSGIPNLSMTLGYTNASWTLKADLSCDFVVRVLRHMDEHGYNQTRPPVDPVGITREPLIDLMSGYVLRALDDFPGQGSQRPWRLRQNYPLDRYEFTRKPVEDGVLTFARGAVHAPSRPPEAVPA